MTYLKNLIRLIKKRKCQYMLFFLQMIVVFLMIQYTLNLLVDDRLFHQKLNSLNQNKISTYFATQDNDSNEMPECSFGEYAEFKKEINKECNNTAFSFSVSDLLLKTNEIPKRFLEFEESHNRYYQVTYISENFLKFYRLKVEQGREFSRENYNETSKKYISVILGSAFQKYFQVGNVIDKQYKIVGILEKKSSYLDIQLNSKIVSLDKQIILPMIYQAKEWGGCYVNHLMFSTEDKSSVDRIKRIIEKYDFKDYNIQKAETQINILKNDFYTELSFMIVLFFTCFSLCLFSIISMLLHLIEEQKTEFGIYMLCGATKMDMCFTIAVPIVVLSIIASFPSMVLCNSIFGCVLQIICMLLIITIILAFPLQYWLKKSISELKKERK
ncbi:MAG: ABC transporter permease [Anaerostipes sp.]|nr:ABC transporter permease [Anaerostipes sp.]MDD3747397.1 ABC transporter permease [Anaerostipes sp.]